MLATIDEEPRTQRDRTSASAWPTWSIRDRRWFDPFALRMTPADDGSRLPRCARPERRDARVDQGWDDQFAELIGPMRGRLHRLARRILRNEDLAEDAVQEALVSLWREGRLPPNPAAWLSRTVIHRSLHLNRSRRRRDRHELLACLHRPEFDRSGEPSRAAMAEEISANLIDALSGLSERLRTVFILREMEQLDYESIAATLQIPLGTVRSRLARAREALQQALARDDLIPARSFPPVPARTGAGVAINCSTAYVPGNFRPGHGTIPVKSQGAPHECCGIWADPPLSRDLVKPSSSIRQ